MIVNKILKNEKLIYKVVLFFYIIILSYSNVIFANDSFLDRSELQDLWIQYLQKMGTMQGDVSWFYSKNGNILDEGTKSVCFYYPYVARESIYNTQKTVGVSGKLYQFHLVADDKNSLFEWSVKSMTQITPEKSSLGKKLYFPAISASDLITHPHDPIGNGICSDFGVPFLLDERLYLPSFILQKEFIITECEKISSDGSEDTIKILFSFFSDDIKKFPTLVMENMPFKMEGEMILSTKFCLITKAHLTCFYGQSKKTISIDCKYNIDNELFPFPTSYISTQNLFDGSPFVMKFSFANLCPTNIKDLKRFTLSHYGLPEPDFDNSRRTNRVRYILMGLGAILILIALWRIIQKRRGRM
jgi:hypothetical protein